MRAAVPPWRSARYRNWSRWPERAHSGRSHPRHTRGCRSGTSHVRRLLPAACTCDPRGGARFGKGGRARDPDRRGRDSRRSVAAQGAMEGPPRLGCGVVSHHGQRRARRNPRVLTGASAAMVKQRLPGSDSSRRLSVLDSRWTKLPNSFNWMTGRNAPRPDFLERRNSRTCVNVWRICCGSRQHWPISWGAVQRLAGKSLVL